MSVSLSTDPAAATLPTPEAMASVLATVEDPSQLLTDDRPRIAIIGAHRTSSYGDYAVSTLAEEITHHGGVVMAPMTSGISNVALMTAMFLGPQREANAIGVATGTAVPADGMWPCFAAVGKGLVRANRVLLTHPRSDSQPGSTADRQMALVLLAHLADAILLIEPTTHDNIAADHLRVVNQANAIGTPVYAVPAPLPDEEWQLANQLIRDGRARYAVGVHDLDLAGITR